MSVRSSEVLKDDKVLKSMAEAGSLVSGINYPFSKNRAPSLQLLR